MGLTHTTHHSSIVLCTLCTIGGTRGALSLGDGVGFIVGFKVGFKVVFRGTRCALSLGEGVGLIVVLRGTEGALQLLKEA